MELDSVFVKNMENKINELIKDKNVIEDMDKLDYLDKLLSIYNVVFSIDTQKQQMKIASESMKMLSNIDLSKLDVNEFIKQFGK